MSRQKERKILRRIATAGIGTFFMSAFYLMSGVNANSATEIPMGVASSYAISAHAGITNIGTSAISGSIATISKFGLKNFGLINQLAGTIEISTPAAIEVENKIVEASQVITTEASFVETQMELAGRSISPGNYANANFELNGTLTLDGGGDPNARFIFKTTSTLKTATGSKVLLTNGANANNVFWRVGSSANLGAGSIFQGNLFAEDSINTNSGSQIYGRLFAITGGVNLIGTTAAIAAAVVPTPSSTAAPTPAPTSTLVPILIPTAIPTLVASGFKDHSNIDAYPIFNNQLEILISNLQPGQTITIERGGP